MKFMNNLGNRLRMSRGFFIFSGMTMILLATVEPSFAQDFSEVNTFLAAVATALTGPIGSTIAILAVMAIGFSFLTGRMDWTFAVAIIIGIAVIFGAATFIGTGLGTANTP